MVNRIADEGHTAPPPIAHFLTALRPVPGNLTATMQLWQAGSGYTILGFSQWTLAIPALGHQQHHPLTERPATVTEPEPILDLISENWVHEAAYPELNLDTARDEEEPLVAAPPAEFDTPPPACTAMAAVPAPEVAERWLDRSLAKGFATAARPAVPVIEGLLSAALNKPQLDAGFMPGPAAEPVASWLKNTAAVEPVGFARALQLPAVPAAVVLTVPELCEYLSVPAAEPVASWLAIADCAVPVAFPRTLILPAPIELTAMEQSPADDAFTAGETGKESCFAELSASPVGAFQPAASAAPAAFSSSLQLPAALELSSIAALAAEAAAADAASGPTQLPVAATFAGPIVPGSALQLPAGLDAVMPVELPVAAVSGSETAFAEVANVPAFAANSAAIPATPVLPAFGFSAELGELDDAMEPPPLCDRLMAPARPEPVWSFLQASSAGALLAAIPPARPVLAANITPTHVPLCTAWLPGLQAEPVMAGVWPRIAETPIERIDSALASKLPEGAIVPTTQGLVAAGPIPSAAPEPVETLLVPSCAAAICEPLSLQLPVIAAVTASIGEASLALPAAGPKAEPAATWIEAASADPVTGSQPVALQPFRVKGDSATAVPVPELPAIAARVAAPAPADHRVIELCPVETLGVILPKQAQQRLTPEVPRPGVLALEYHMQRMRGECYERLEWKSVTYQPQPPAFNLRAIPENLEEMVKPKAPLAGVFPINNRRPLVSRSKLMEHVLRVAAAVLIVTSIWGGAAALKNARRITVRPAEQSAFATPNRVLTPESQKVAKAAEGKGPVNWFRHAVANRASLQVGEDFQGDMQRWTSEGGAPPANWRRNAAGYAVTGSLALFRPTSKFDDYKLEFFGQIESKSIGWVVRAKDAKNYHAMKFTTIEHGLRPIIAMVHYSVVDGKAGRRTQTPLNVMVHNNKPFQVAVTVRGKHFVTEVDGEEVDRFREDGLPVGGVGFFSEAGETARLYWARVTKNDDWLGHVCAFLSGGESQATAALRPPAFPGGVPAPWAPAGDSAILTAAWIGLPTFRRTQSPKRQKRCNR